MNAAIYIGDSDAPFNGQIGRARCIDDGSALYEGAWLFVPDDREERERVGGYIVGREELTLTDVPPPIDGEFPAEPEQE